MTVFTPNYLKAFKDELIDSIMSENDEGVPADFQLLERPIDTAPLKTGYLVKRGGTRKNWKRRFFIIKHNYEVEYWEDEESVGKEGAKPKGVVSCCGLRLVEDPSIDLDKPFLFELRHSVKRCWFFEAESAEEKEEWMKVFRLCCRKAEVPLNPDPIMREAFIKAYRETRWALYIWDSNVYYITCAEGEQLGLLVSCKLERVVMSDIYAALPKGGSGKIGSIAKKKVQSIINGIVGSAIATGWNAVSAQIEEIKPTIEEGVRAAVAPIRDAESSLRGKIKEAIMEKLDPILATTVTPIVAKVFEILSSSQVESYTELVRAFSDILEELQNSSDLQQSLDRINSSIRWSYSSRLWKARVRLEGCREKLEALNEIVREISPWNIINDLSDGLVRLIRNAVYTLELELAKGVSLEDAGQRVKEMLVNDARQTLRVSTHDILFNLVSSPLRGAALSVVNPIIEPLEGLIPGPVKQFVSVSKSLSALLDDLVNAMITEGTKVGAEQCMTRICL
ncbi:hypothetical protein RCL1_007585 [Eukaryota sp. TZLM3-RCL]